MEKLLKDLCKQFNGHRKTIKTQTNEHLGVPIGVFNTHLTYAEAEQLHKQTGCFTKAFRKSSEKEEWVVYVIKTNISHFELWETLPDSCLSEIVFDFYWKDLELPMIFLVQRKAEGVLIGCAVNMMDDTLRIEINPHGIPAKLN